MNRVLQDFCANVASLGIRLFHGAFDSKRDKEPESFISLENGQPIPLFKGETKKEATENFIKKKA